MNLVRLVQTSLARKKSWYGLSVPNRSVFHEKDEQKLTDTQTAVFITRLQWSPDLFHAKTVFMILDITCSLFFSIYSMSRKTVDSLINLNTWDIFFWVSYTTKWPFREYLSPRSFVIYNLSHFPRILDGIQWKRSVGKPIIIQTFQIFKWLAANLPCTKYN